MTIHALMNSLMTSLTVLQDWWYVYLSVSCCFYGHQFEHTMRFPCAICRSGVGVNSIECSQCKLWVHKKCSGLTGRLVADPEFVCQRCRGVACPFDGRPVTHVDVDGTQLDVEATFCYLGDMFSAGGGCDHAIAARCCASGASSESCCQSSLQSTSL